MLRLILAGLVGRHAARTAPDPLIAVAGLVRERLARPRGKRLDVARVVYMANLLHIARHDAPLFEDRFEATAMGPLVPRMMDELRHARTAAHDAHHRTALTPRQTALVDEVCAHYADATSVQLFCAVEAEGGAWRRRFVGGWHSTDRGPTISERDLREEVSARLAA